MINFGKLSLFVLGFIFSSQSANAAVISWANWTSANSTNAIGSIDDIDLEFTGNINPAAQVNNFGINYWEVNSSVYTASPNVDNPPPTSDIIRLTGGFGTVTQTLNFSAPIQNPVMAILSLGSTNIEVLYDFDQDFEILNSGAGFFGGGILNELSGDILQGFEGHGLIQFNGNLSSISWTIPQGEFWHGFTIGSLPESPPDPDPTSVPEPYSVLSLLALSVVDTVSEMKGKRKRN